MPPKKTPAKKSRTPSKQSESPLLVIGPSKDWCEAVATAWQNSKAQNRDQSISIVEWNDFLYHREPLANLLKSFEENQPSSGTIFFGWRPPNRILWDRQLEVLNRALPKDNWKKLGIHVSPQGLPGVAMHDERPAALKADFIELCDKIEDAVTISGWEPTPDPDQEDRQTSTTSLDFNARIRHFLLVLQDIESTRDREAARSSVPARNQFIEEMIREIQGDKQAPPAMTMLERWSAARLLATVLARESRLIDDQTMTDTIDNVLKNFQSPAADIKATANDYLTIATLCLAIDPRNVKAAEARWPSDDRSEILVSNLGHKELSHRDSSSRLVMVHFEFLKFIKSASEAMIDNYQITFDERQNGITIRKATCH